MAFVPGTFSNEETDQILLEREANAAPFEFGTDAHTAAFLAITPTEKRIIGEKRAEIDALDEEIRREFRPGKSLGLQTQRVQDNIELATGLRRSFTNPGFFFRPTQDALSKEARGIAKNRTLIGTTPTGTKLTGRRVRLSTSLTDDDARSAPIFGLPQPEQGPTRTGPGFGGREEGSIVFGQRDLDLEKELETLIGFSVARAQRFGGGHSFRGGRA